MAYSAGTVYRVLSQAGLPKRNTQRSLKGTGFQQPLAAHDHWRIDISYLNIAGTFYFMASVLDNGPQFIAKDFKHFVRLCGMKHVRTSPYYPQSNGKIERYHRTIKAQCIRPLSTLSLDDAKRGVEKFVTEYNTVRLHSAIGYVTPQAMLEGRQQAIFEERDRKLAEARQRRAEARTAARNKANAASSASSNTRYTDSDAAEDRALLGSTLSATALPLTDEGSGLSEITSISAATASTP